MKRIIALFLVALTASFTVAAQELPGAVTKKFIAFGWEFGFYNDPAFLLENADLFASVSADHFLCVFIVGVVDDGFCAVIGEELALFVLIGFEGRMLGRADVVG